MKFFILIIVLLTTTCLYSTIINVPGDQPTIQAGIDASIDADTVLVQPGTYVENINYNGKLITVASLFLTTADTTYISQTIIDGNEFGSVVTIASGEDSTTVLLGFTITNGVSGSGGGIYCNNSSPSLNNLTITSNTVWAWEGGHGFGGGIACWYDSSPSLNNVTISDNLGGGIYCYNSSPSLNNVTITGNYTKFGDSLNSTNGKGGGMDCRSNSSPTLTNVIIADNSADNAGGGINCMNNSNPSLQNVTITGNTSYSGGGIHCRSNSNPSFDSVNRCNIFLNYANYGCDLYSSDYYTIIDVIVDTFTVLQPDNYFARPIENFTFDILNAKVEQVDQDLYVSPEGSNDNSGLTISDPLLTISYALIKTIPNSTNPHTIYLSNGTYSPTETGEMFPLSCRSYVSIIGIGEDVTILDGDAMSEIFHCRSENNFSIGNMTIQNGYAFFGGGICCYDSSPSLMNVTITGNTADAQGGGIYCYSSSPSLVNVTITGNTAEYVGGGIFCYINSNPNLVNCIMWNDSPQEIYISSGSVIATYSDIQGGWAGTGNIDQNPLFVGSGDHPFSLMEASPCIDAGIPDTLGLNLLPWDIIGNERIWDGDGNGSAIIDMGAYEYGAPANIVTSSPIPIIET